MNWINNILIKSLSLLIKAKQIFFKEYNHSPIFTPEQKANQKKIIGYSSYYVTGLFQESIKFVKTMTNKSFDALPDNIQTKLLDMARDVNVFLNKVKVSLNIINLNWCTTNTLNVILKYFI